MALEVGLIGELAITVQADDTAQASGGGNLPEVLSTPRLISLLERTANASLKPYLAENQASVGTLVNIRHLGATPLGMQVRFRSELLEIDRRRMRFKVEAWDEVEKVAEGEHERFIIDLPRFEERLETKRLAMKH